MNCTIHIIKREVVVVKYVAGGIPAAKILSSRQLPSAKVGEVIDIPENVLHLGIDYGIDWGMLLDEPITITGDMLTTALRKHGVWTHEDLITMPTVVKNVIANLVSLAYGDLVKNLRELMR